MFLWSGSFDRLLSLFAVLCPTYSVLDLFCLVLWPWSYPTSVPGSPLSRSVLWPWHMVFSYVCASLSFYSGSLCLVFCPPISWFGAEMKCTRFVPRLLSYALWPLCFCPLAFCPSSLVLFVWPLLYFVYGIIQRSLEAVIYDENGRCHRSGDDNSLSDR